MTRRRLGKLSRHFEDELRIHATERKIKRGEMLSTRGSLADAFYYVASGRIRVSITGPNGREAVIGVLCPGQWFGEVSLLGNLPHFYDTFAAEESTVLAVPSQIFHEAVQRHPTFLLELTHLISARYRVALEWIDETILMPLPARLAKRLLATYAGHERRKDDRTVALRVSQEDLSHMLGVSRKSVNRQLKVWESQGILKIQYGGVAINDLSKLRTIAVDRSEDP